MTLLAPASSATLDQASHAALPRDGPSWNLLQLSNADFTRYVQQFDICGADDCAGRQQVAAPVDLPLCATNHFAHVSRLASACYGASDPLVQCARCRSRLNPRTKRRQRPRQPDRQSFITAWPQTGLFGHDLLAPWTHSWLPHRALTWASDDRCGSNHWASTALRAGARGWGGWQPVLFAERNRGPALPLDDFLQRARRSIFSISLTGLLCGGSGC